MLFGGSDNYYEGFSLISDNKDKRDKKDHKKDHKKSTFGSMFGGDNKDKKDKEDNKKDNKKDNNKSTFGSMFGGDKKDKNDNNKGDNKVDNKVDDTDPSGAKFGDIEDSKTWTAFIVQLVWTMLQLFCFTIIMANFIYLKMLTPNQMNMFFPSVPPMELVTRGQVPRFSDSANDWFTWPHPLNDCEPSPTMVGVATEAVEAAINPFAWMSLVVKDWWKCSMTESYMLLREGIKAFLSFGYDTNSQRTPPLYNNMLFQSIFFFVAFFLWASHFMFFGVWLVNFVLGIQRNPLLGLFPGIFSSFFLAWWQSTQFIVTLLFLGLARDWEQTSGETISTIIQRNIPTILFLFGFNVAMNSSTSFGNVTMFGMLLWCVWATYKS